MTTYTERWTEDNKPLNVKSFVCENCYQTFESLRKRKYCSYECEKEVSRNKQRLKRDKALKTGEWNGKCSYLKLRFSILKRDNFRCVYCGKSSKDNVTLHIDHIEPKSKKGKLTYDNLVTACYECNEGKKDVLLSEREKETIKKRKKKNAPRENHQKS